MTGLSRGMQGETPPPSPHACCRGLTHFKAMSYWPTLLISSRKLRHEPPVITHKKLRGGLTSKGLVITTSNFNILISLPMLLR